MASSRTWGIVAALALAAGLIVAAWLLSNVSTSVARPAAVTAAGTDAFLQEVASRDSDGDGLPDWEETLYGTDPKRVDSDNDGILDGEAARRGLLSSQTIKAGTVASSDTGDTSVDSASLTSRFARTFFELYIQARQNGSNLSKDQINDLVTRATTLLASDSSTAVSGSVYSSQSLTFTPDGQDAYRLYLANAERAFAKYTIQTEKSELLYLKDAVTAGDASAFEKINQIAKAYRAIADALIIVPVPQSLAEVHVAIANALRRMSVVTEDLAGFESDPVRALVALSKYEGDVLHLRDVFQGLSDAFSRSAVAMSPGEPGYSLLSVTK